MRVAIVEDEAPARARLKRLLAAHDDVEVVAEADELRAALQTLPQAGAEVLFLDIALGTASGFDLLDRLPEPWPLVVFATAYHEHALRAFDVAAVDYLLKPFDDRRLARTLERLRERLAEDDPLPADEEVRRVQAAMPQPPAAPPRLVVIDRGRRVLVPLESVTRIESCGNYVELHTAARTFLLRTTLTRLAQRLDPDEWLRVHRRHLVRAGQIQALTPRAHGDADLTLCDGTEVQVSRRYRDALPEALRSR